MKTFTLDYFDYFDCKIFTLDTINGDALIHNYYYKTDEGVCMIEAKTVKLPKFKYIIYKIMMNL